MPLNKGNAPTERRNRLNDAGFRAFPVGCPAIFMNGILYFHHHHHHHVVPLARISLILSRHFSLSFIASGRSSGLHPVSSHSCCMYVLAGRPVFARPYVGVHRSTSLMSSRILKNSVKWIFSFLFLHICF